MTSSSLSQLPYHPLLKEAKQMRESLNETQGLQAKLNRQEKATSFLFYAFAISLSAAFIF
tara:strand:+ start:139 stop:318 length:180 start_codon:yes stop_codon:yes gene_type:complete